MKGYSRLDYFICSKIPPGFQEYSKAKKIIESSNKSVNLGYLDCVLLLWPGPSSKNIDEKDPVNITNRHDCWRALEDSIDEK
jgi:diketogulonate reductase-like aldo/keto reductase